MASYSDRLEQIQSLSLKACAWKGSLPFEWECDELEPDTGKQKKEKVDLLDYVTPNQALEKHLKKYQKYPPNTCFQFPPKFMGPDSKDDLVKSIVSQAAKKSGQKLLMRSSHDGAVSKNRISSQRLITVQIVCSQFYTYQQKTKREFEDRSYAAKGTKKSTVHQSHKPKSHPKNYRATTSKPIDEEGQCPFHITIFMSSDNRWYLSTNGWSP